MNFGKEKLQKEITEKGKNPKLPFKKMEVCFFQHNIFAEVPKAVIYC